MQAHKRHTPAKSTFALLLVLKNAHTENARTRMIKVNTEELINTEIPLMVFIFKGFPKTGTLWIPGEAELLSVTAIRISNEVLALKGKHSVLSPFHIMNPGPDFPSVRPEHHPHTNYMLKKFPADTNHMYAAQREA